MLFEEGILPKEQWHHSEHVAMAFWYLIHFDEELAIDKMRQGIRNLNLKHGVPQTPTGGYHETWTIFFAKMLKQYIARKLNRELSLIEQVNHAIEYLADFRELTLRYYSKELIMSWEARTAWRDPDIKSL